MMTIPHQFPSLIEGPAQVVLIAGTGLSTPDAPTVDELKCRLTDIERDNGVAVVDDFYDLAEAEIQKRIMDGNSEDESRLQLALHLGMLDDPRWFGNISLPLQGHTPRHRAIARLAVEQRLRAIICLNWDCLLETALESVGLTEGSTLPRPWKVTSYARVVDDLHMSRLSGSHVFALIKPHGCVRELDAARRQRTSTGTVPHFTFKLTKSEMRNQHNQSLVDKKVEGCVSECPLVAVGWKAGEDYLRNMVVATAMATQHKAPDCFTLVSRTWYKEHTEIANAYCTCEAAAFLEVAKPTAPTTDDVFMWLQARFALSKLIAVSLTTQQTRLTNVLSNLDWPNSNNALLHWVDCWLHTWVRLCWRAGVMQGFDPHTNRIVVPSELPLTPRDLHIPLAGMSHDRRDLRAAARLLFELTDSLPRFDYKQFPGGLWDKTEHSLYLPLPGWCGTETPSYLTALQPLIEAMPHLGLVDKVLLVWLDCEDVTPDESLRQQLQAQVASLLPLAGIACTLQWTDLQSLKEATDAAMA